MSEISSDAIFLVTRRSRTIVNLAFIYVILIYDTSIIRYTIMTLYVVECTDCKHSFGYGKHTAPCTDIIKSMYICIYYIQYRQNSLILL